MAYRLQDVERIIGAPRSVIRAFIDHGFVKPSRAGRGFVFTFQDLIVLRMAKELKDARLPARRITSALKSLRANLPESLPLSGLRIAAVGSDVVVTEADTAWRAADGQYLLALEVTAVDGSVLIENPADEESFHRALALEDSDPGEAMRLYRDAIRRDCCAGGAYVNLGRLLQQAGKAKEAETLYRQGRKACPDDALLLFNYALLKEDKEEWEMAIQLYMEALTAEPDLSDAHYNLALLYHSLRLEQDALRHFSAYRKLTKD
jgi:tetratricopeptide (TPR) repeat protein